MDSALSLNIGTLKLYGSITIYHKFLLGVFIFYDLINVYLEVMKACERYTETCFHVWLPFWGCLERWSFFFRLDGFSFSSVCCLSQSARFTGGISKKYSAASKGTDRTGFSRGDSLGNSSLKNGFFPEPAGWALLFQAYSMRFSSNTVISYPPMIIKGLFQLDSRENLFFIFSRPLPYSWDMGSEYPVRYDFVFSQLYAGWLKPRTEHGKREVEIEKLRYYLQAFRNKCQSIKKVASIF